MDRNDFAPDDASDEFDDERTTPVYRGSDAENHRDDDSCENLVTDSDPAPPADPVPDEPCEPGIHKRSHLADEFTSPVLPGSDDENRIGHDPADKPGDKPADDACEDSGENPSAVADDLLTARSGRDTPLEPGFVLRDRFEIVNLAHSGGMSHVYKAIDRRRHTLEWEQSYVAIKMLRPSALPEHDEAATLEREAASAQRLSHPNIVNIYDFEMHGGQFYLVMEWLEGETVKDRLQRTSGRLLAAEFSWQIIHGVASALEHAHTNNVVHADINLSNIVVTDTQQIKLLDFGVARFSSGEEDVASDEPIWVTHKYASPEVLSGSTPVFTDDIFSLGCVAYRLLSGRHPFAGTSSLEAKESGLTVQPIAGLSVRRWQIISQTLAFSRSDRPGTASVFLDQQSAWTGEAARRIPQTIHGAPETTQRVRETMRRVPKGMHRVRETMRRVPKGMQRVRETMHRIPETMHGIRDTLQRLQAVPRAPWLIAIPVAAVVLAVGLWSLLRTGTPDGPAAVQQPAVVAEPQVTDTPRPVPALQEFLGRAAQAMSAERYVLPENDSARFFYNEVLAIDPDNPAAVAGLHDISGIYLQQASSALNAEKLSEAAAALAIAADTSPDNPEIGVVNELLVARVDATLAKAREAAVEGDLPQAAALLAEIDRNPLVDGQELDEIRRLVATNSKEQQLAEALARVDEHIAARRLTVPDGNNAYTLLLELREQHAGDNRLRATTDRLGNQLLAEAVIASAAGEEAQLRRLLGAAENLGVNPDEIEQTRQSLATASEQPPDTQTAAATPVASPQQQPTATAATGETAQPPAEAEIASASGEEAQAAQPSGAVASIGLNPDEIEQTRQIPAAGSEQPPDTQTAAATPAASPQQQPTATAATGETAQLPAEAADTPPASAGSGTTAADRPAQPRSVSLETMQIEKYVAPVYPLNARWRRLTGYVEMRFRILADGSTADIEVVSSEPGDVFVSSAKKALSKWRFAQPDEEVIAQVTVRFEEE